MDEVDKGLLNIIQTDFPIASRPYQVLGERLGISEEEALGRVRALVESGIIRRIGPSFDTRKLGHVSTLVAAKVPAERLEEVAGIVSSFPQVTHNYGRDFEYNLWFTIIAKDDSEIKRTLDKIKAETGVSDMHELPAKRMFKIKVEFEF
ncbi:MAG TPA: AsnC family transcriptional regulator [Armatimonadota bacterium]|nr:AsnC family transcriptional regulator [Armatimonadota bacterium]